jgi:hypothetical protein
LSILFATPAYGGEVKLGYDRGCKALAAELTACGFQFAWLDTENESLITRGRNTMVAQFRRTEFEYLMWIDSDIEFTADDVGKLLAMNADVAAGCYRMKKPGSKYAAWVNGALIDDLDKFKEPVAVDYAGTGFMMIHRRVFDKLEPHVTPLWEGQVGECHGFFSQKLISHEDSGRYIELPEDYSFCLRWRDIGGKVMMDPSVRLIHHGSFAYGQTA